MGNFRLLTLVNALFYVAIGLSAPLMTLFLEALGANYAQISLILTSATGTMLLMSYVWGWWSDRLSRRRILLVGGLLGLAGAYMLLSQAGSSGWAWGARVVEGAAMAAYATVSLAVIGDTLEASAQRGRSMGLYRGLGSLAFSGGALAGGLLADAYSTSFVLMVSAGFFLAAGVGALFLEDRRPPPVEQDVRQEPPRSSWRSLPAAFLVGVLLWTTAHAASTSMWPNYMATFGYSKAAISGLWSLAAFVEMPAMYLAGALSDVFGRALLLAAGGFAIALVQVGYLLLAGFLPALLGVQVLRGLGFGSFVTTSMTFTAEHGGQSTRGGRSGIFNTTSSAGQLAGMLMGGLLVQNFGFANLYMICAVLAAGSGVCFLALRRGARADHLAAHVPTANEIGGPDAA
jgi:MFS family permease